MRPRYLIDGEFDPSTLFKPTKKPTSQEQKVKEGRERRETRYLRRRRGPPPKKKAPAQAQTQGSYGEGVIDATVGAGDTDLAPDDPMSQTIREQAGPLYYTPPDQPPEGTVDPVDRIVTRVTGALWGRAEAIRPSTQPLSYEEQRYRMKKRELPDLPLAMKRAELGALNIGIGAIEGFTFPVRPSAWIRTAESLVGLATDVEKRKEAIEFAQVRPEAVGLQILGGVAGGYAAGKMIGRLRGPKTYTLKEKTIPLKPKDVTSPATKMPRGKWRSTWEITRKGGTAVVQLKDRPGFISYYEPTPVYGLSRIGFVGLSGIHGRTTTSIKSDPVVRQTVEQTQRVGVDPVQRRREREISTIRDLTKGRTEQRRTILPDVHTFVRPRPTPAPPGFVEPPIVIQEPTQRQPVIVIPELGLEQTQIQEQRQRQAMAIPQIQRFSYREPNLEPVFLRRRKKGRKGGLDLFTFGEIRAYPLKSVEKMLKEMGI